MKNKSILIKDFATFVGETETYRGNKMLNLSGDITFLLNTVRKGMKPDSKIELTKDMQDLWEDGAKFFGPSIYPFPAKGKQRTGNETSVVCCKSDAFETDIELKKFVTNCANIDRETWINLAVKAMPKSAKNRFAHKKEDVKKTANPRIAKKVTSNSEANETLAQKVLDNFGDWENIDAPGMKKLVIACKKFGGDLKEIRKIVDTANEPDDTDSLQDFDF